MIFPVIYQDEHTKHKLGYIAHDFDAEMKRSETDNEMEKWYDTPQGDALNLISTKITRR